MTSRLRKWLAASILLGASGMAVWGVASPLSGEVAQAAPPASSLQFSVPSQDGTKQGQQPRRESVPPVQNGPAARTGPASAFQPLVGSPDAPVFGANVRANTDSQSPNLAQQEPSIAINPTNPLNVVASAKDERAGSNSKQTWIYTSTDGGVTWLNQLFPFSPAASPFSSDPVVKFSDTGVCLVTSLPYGGGAGDGIQVSRSTDGGVTFAPGVHVPGTDGGSDKEWTWIDNYPTSPHYHRTYVAWMNFSPGFKVAYSDDFGATWTLTSVAQSANQFPMPMVFPNGDVEVIYNSGGSFRYIRSTNGGTTWGASQLISSFTNAVCPPDNSGCGIWRLNSIPVIGVDPNNGNAVTVWSDGRTGKSLIYYNRSTDNGVTWNTAAQLAPPGIANTYQVEPWVEADELGTFHAVWYDDRENPNTSIFHIYYSQSTDDGVTWSNAVRISTATSDLRIGIPSSYNLAAGDYINVTASHGNVYAAWTDTRAGNGEDIYTVRGIDAAVQGTPTPTATGTRPTNTATRTSTNTPTITPTVCGGSAPYTIAVGTGTIVPGTTNTGSSCDDCLTTVALPFPVRLYDQTFNSVDLDSNGNAQFVTDGSSFSNSCLPGGTFTYTIFPYWDDLLTNGTACSPSPCGIYTSISGTAPNRIFNIEWRANYFSGSGSANFELKLYEGTGNSHFDVIYGLVSGGNTSATGGVQRDATLFTQAFCNGSGQAITNGLMLSYSQPPCGTPVPITPSATATQPAVPSSTSTVAVSPTVCIPSQVQVNIQGFSFQPQNVTIAAGSTVNWTNLDGTTHTSSSTTGVWDSGNLAQNQSFQFTFTTPGIYTYICMIHPSMTGTINVVPSCVTPSAVPSSTRTAVPSTTAQPTATVCPIQFTDVPPGHTFYDSIRCLACRGIVSGYADGTFRPDNLVTRGQLAKMVSNAGNFQEDPGPQIFNDVPPAQPFYPYINRLTNRGYMSGYECGSPGEPCPGRYFRPYANATRGQTSKIVANAAGFSEEPTTQTFEDVPPTYVFYKEIERLASRGVMGGYECGGPGEPCGNPPRPYFRPGNNVTRGQSAKIVSNAFFPGCQPTLDK